MPAGNVDITNVVRTPGEDMGRELKHYFNPDPIIKYCIEHSHKLHPAQLKLIQATLDHPRSYMLGPMEVIRLCTCFLKQMKSVKKVLDVGTFTGFSALSWALCMDDDGRVIAMDINDEDYNNIGRRVIEDAGQAHKIDLRVQPAMKTLDELIAGGESGTFDFAFLDTDKEKYPQYYERVLQLLRPGGMIACDNALWGGTALNPGENTWAQGVDKLNKILFSDKRVENNLLLPIGDGFHLAFKK